MNDAWRYCANLTPTEPEKALAGACLTALLTIEELQRKGISPDWQRVAAELPALEVAGHPAGKEK